MHPFVRSKLFQSSIRLILAGAMLLLCASCDRKADRELRVGYLPLIASLPHFIALEKNSYSSNGVTAQSQEIASSNDLINGLVAGQFDMLPAVSIIPVIH